MNLKTAGIVLALLLASGVGCGKQSGEAPPASSPPAIQAVTPAPAPAAETAPATVTPPADKDAVAAGESVQESPAASSADAANIKLAEAVTQKPAAVSSRWKEGVNYTLVTPVQPTASGPDKVEVTEIFWYGCPHCYALEPFLQNWIAKKAPYVQFNRVPVTWGPVHQLHAKLYYTLLALKREDLHVAAFRESQFGDHLIGRDLADTERVQQGFAKRQGIDSDAFTTAYRSKEVADNMAKAQETTLRYKVENVPNFVVNGKYLTSASQAGGESQLLALINDLAAAEHGKKN